MKAEDSLRDLTNTVGALVYCVSYVPIWVGWNLIGKHVARAFESVKYRSESSDRDLVIHQGTSLEVLRRMITHAYYTRVLVEEERKCVRSA